MVDYLIIGLGLAGVSFAEQLEEHGKTFHVISDDSQTSSSVAGGLYNPVILKRFTLAWKAHEQLERAMHFYASLERKLGLQLNYPLEILRRFHSAEEQNQWFTAMDKPHLAELLSAKVYPNTNLAVDAPFGFGKVQKTGRIAANELLQQYMVHLRRLGKLSHEYVDHRLMRMANGTIEYKSFKARRVVFAEGFGLKKNPFFNYLPLQGNKGEYVIIKAPGLQEERAIKSSIFCIPLGNDLYKVGANYDRSDFTNDITERTKTMLLQKLERFIRCEYQVVGQVAGVRPTVSDRRPLVGRHPEHAGLYVLNGLGSRGVLIAPYVAPQLYRLIEYQEALDPEIDCARFEKKWIKK